MGDVTLDQQFDAIVGRLVLQYLPKRAALLGRLMQHLGPGGVVAFQEYDLSTVPASSTRLTLAERLRVEIVSHQGVARSPALVWAWTRIEASYRACWYLSGENGRNPEVIY